MNTKEAIEVLSHEEMAKYTSKEGLTYQEYVEYKKYREKIDEIIKLIQRLEKCEKIVEEIEERLMPGKVNAVECPDDTNMGDLSTLDFIRLVIKDIKKKYFPDKETIKREKQFDKMYKDITNFHMELLERYFKED